MRKQHSSRGYLCAFILFVSLTVPVAAQEPFHSNCLDIADSLYSALKTAVKVDSLVAAAQDSIQKDCLVIQGTILSGDEQVLQLWGVAVPADGNYIRKGVVTTNRNLVLVDYDTSAVWANFYGTTKFAYHQFSHQATGTNEAGETVPAYVYSLPPQVSGELLSRQQREIERTEVFSRKFLSCNLEEIQELVERGDIELAKERVFRIEEIDLPIDSDDWLADVRTFLPLTEEELAMGMTNRQFSEQATARAQEALAAGRFRIALEDIHRALEYDATNLKAISTKQAIQTSYSASLRGRALLLINARRYQTAWGLLNEAESLDPQNPDTRRLFSSIPTKRKSVATARLLSIVPGVAHFYSDSNRAGTWLLGSALVGTALLTSPENRGLGVLVIGIPLTVSILDGPNSVRRYNQRLPTREQISQISISYSGEHRTGMVSMVWTW